MKDRILNLLLVFFLTLLIVNWFLPNPSKQATTDGTVTIQALKDTSVIPNLPTINITNGLVKDITIDTCRDLEVQKDYVKLTGLPKEFCKTLTVKSHAKEKLDLSALVKLFTVAGKYDFRLTTEGITTGTAVTQETPGMIRSFLTHLFYEPVYNFFAFLLSYIPGHNLGVAIILVTVFIRVLLLIPQHHILVNSKKMQAIQPKIKELQEKHKGDQAKIGMELMALYKEEQVNPLGSCLPLLFQMPLLIVLYWVVTGISDSSNVYHLYSFLSGFDISKIDTMFLGINLHGIGGITGGVLAVIVAAAQWLQIKLSLPKVEDVKKLEKLEKKAILEKKDGKYEEEAPSMMPDPHVMNAFMLWGMPVMILISTYYFPAGVGIYWLIGTLFMLAQQVVVNKMGNSKQKK